MCPFHPGAQYRYTEQLLALEQHRPQELQLWFPRGPSPLQVEVWCQRLSTHPDQRFALYIVQGIMEGFRIGANRSFTLHSGKQNMLSAVQYPAVIEEYLAEEVRLGRLLPLPWGTSVHTSRFGVIPKGHVPGKWRMITDLFSPHGASVNDAIHPDLCSLEYITVDCVARRACEMGPGALLAKADVKSAYRIVPVHPDDIPLLGVQWNGKSYMDRMLPFGLRSAPKIFNALADALEWVCRQAGVKDIYHYLDDFAIVGPPESPTCARHLGIFRRECRVLGVPLAEDKTEGPATCLTPFGH